MASPRVRITVSKKVSETDLQKKLLAIIGNETTQRGVNTIIANRIEKYVPMKSGALRESVQIGPKTITWGSKLTYAHYQYEGDVYGPNFPILNEGNPEWRSIKGFTKYPTGRKLGSVEGIAILPPRWKIEGGAFVRPTAEDFGTYTFGYTTSGTTYHWDREMLRNEERPMKIEITNYLKRRAKELQK